MIIFFKNYKRSDRTLLSIKSVRHFYPKADIRCLFLYDDIDDYKDVISDFLKLDVQIFYDKKKYNFGPGGHSSNNGYYFTEGINKIQSLCKNEEKVLIVDEDTFFTNGETLKFLYETEFDLAFANWGCGFNPVTYFNRPKVEINGSIIGINSKKLNYLFPIIEKGEYIEFILGHELYQKCIDDMHNVVKIPTRDNWNFFGDGVWTNDVEVIKNELKKVNIAYE